MKKISNVLFQSINFLLMPAWLRVTFVSVASFVWLNVLSWVKSQPLSSCPASN